MEVNYFGNIRICQAFLPLLQSKENAKTDFRRMVFTGTGGGPCSPCPPLLSAYMSSKFAGEAMAQVLKQELYMTQGDGPTVDVSVSAVTVKNSPCVCFKGALMFFSVITYFFTLIYFMQYYYKLKGHQSRLCQTNTTNFGGDEID
jgi:hypothetical protein